MRISISCLGWISAVPRAPSPWTDSGFSGWWFKLRRVCVQLLLALSQSPSGRDKVISSPKAKHSLQLRDYFPGEGRANLRRWESFFLINNEAFPKQLSRKHLSRASSAHSQGVVLPFVPLKPGSAQGVATQLLTSPSGPGCTTHSFKLFITINSYPQSCVCAQEREGSIEDSSSGKKCFMPMPVHLKQRKITPKLSRKKEMSVGF